VTLAEPPDDQRSGIVLDALRKSNMADDKPYWGLVQPAYQAGEGLTIAKPNPTGSVGAGAMKMRSRCWLLALP